MSTISLPKFERVSFRNPQLAEVVCQLRFSPVLRIISEMPSQFQDLLRREYPTLSQEHGLQIHVGAEQAAVSPAPSQAWHFGSADGKWIVALAPNFVTLKTTAYTTFDEFYERLRTVQQHLEAVYEPGLYGRVGLHFATGQIDPAAVESMLRRFRETLYNLFRWSLTEQGFTSLEPVLDVQGDKDE